MQRKNIRADFSHSKRHYYKKYYNVDLEDVTMSKSKKASGAELLSPQETVKVKVRHLSSKISAIFNISLPLCLTFHYPLPGLQLVLSGERDKLKKLTKEKLELSGWTDDLRHQCRGKFKHLKLSFYPPQNTSFQILAAKYPRKNQTQLFCRICCQFRI